jgi:ABC-type multidrug transport system fused ATPase/permease subunit
MLQKIWDLLTRSERRQSMLLLVLVLIGMVLEVVGIGLIFPMLNSIIDPDFLLKFNAPLLFGYDLRDVDHKHLVVAIIVGFAFIYLLKTWALIQIFKRQMIFVYGLQASLSRRLFRTYLMQPYTFHIERNSAPLVRNTINEVNLFAQNGVLQLITLVAETLVLFGILSFLFYVQPLAALVSMTVVIFAASLFYFSTHSRILDWGEKRQHHEGLRMQHLQQGLGGVKDIKLLGRELNFVDRFGFHTNESAKVGRLAHTLQQYPRVLFELLGVLLMSGMLLVVVFRDLSLESMIPLIAVFAAAALRLIPSANRILSSLQVARFSLPVVNTLHADLSSELGSKAKVVDQSRQLAIVNELALQRVSFRYPGAQEYSLRNVSLAIKQGQSVGIVGSSGAGKSTLIDLILGLLQPDEGEVQVDGLNISGNIGGWQSTIGYVPQSIYLNDESLKFNIAYGLREDEIDDQAVLRSISAAKLDEFVASLPEGINASVGERVVKISGGQLQIIGIARALYRNPSILVLDEATSALDGHTEASVMESVRSLHGQKTIIIVAHRYSTVSHCDVIFKMENGRVVGVGSPEQIIGAKTTQNAEIR